MTLVPAVSVDCLPALGRAYDPVVQDTTMLLVAAAKPISGKCLPGMLAEAAMLVKNVIQSRGLGSD